MEEATTKHDAELLALQTRASTAINEELPAVEASPEEEVVVAPAPSAETAATVAAADKVAVVEGGALDGVSPDAAASLVLKQLKACAQRDGAGATAALFAPFDGGGS